MALLGYVNNLGEQSWKCGMSESSWFSPRMKREYTLTNYYHIFQVDH